MVGHVATPTPGALLEHFRFTRHSYFLYKHIADEALAILLKVHKPTEQKHSDVIIG